MNELDKLLVELPAPLVLIVERMDLNALGTVFVVDKDRHLLGTATDGDVRRALLAGATLETTLTTDSQLFNRSPRALPVSCRAAEAWAMLDRGIRVIPLLDEEGRVVDFSTRDRLRRIPILEPDIGELELSNLIECAKTGWISSQGKFIREFEDQFAEYLGGGQAIAVANGTVALQLGMTAMGIGAGDEVIVPDFTFGASVSSIVHCGATPVLVDVDPSTWTLDLACVRAAITPRTKAIMPVHIYGQPAHMDELRELADSAPQPIRIIEDAAESLGAEYKGRRIGLDGDCSCFSFFANKVITTGEGGMVVFKDAALSDRARVLRDHGMNPKKRYWHDELGFNFRMTNMQAAVGVAQLTRIDSFRARRRDMFDRYDSLLSGIAGIQLLPKNDWSTSSYWLYTVVVGDLGEDRRDAIMAAMSRRGVDARPGFYPMHIMPPFAAYGHGSYPVATHLAANTISLPSSPSLLEADQRHIVTVFLDALAAADRRTT